MNEVYSLFLWVAQVSTVPGAGNQPAGGGAGGAADGGAGSIWTFMLMMLPLIFLMMLLTQKSQPKEQQRQKKFLEELKKNDRVVTAGGILGTVVNIAGDSEFVTIKIDENNNTKLQILKQSIVRVLKETETTKEG